MELVAIHDPDDKIEMALFESAAHRVYATDPIWAPASEMMWQQRFRQLHDDRGAFVLPLVTMEEGLPVARCMLQLLPEARDAAGQSQGWIGFFECLRDFQASAKLMLAHAEEVLRDHQARTVVISKSDNQHAGVLTAGFDLPHIVFTSHNPPFYYDFLLSCGYVPETKMITLYFTRENAVRFDLSLPGLQTREFNRSNLEEEINIFHSLQNAIFTDRLGYVPRAFEEDRQLVHSFLPFLDDRFVIIAENADGEPVGLLVCIPDIYQQYAGQEINRARILSLGAIPGYTNKGVGALMGAHLMRNLLDNDRYTSVEASWILQTNQPPRNLAKRFNALPGKEYWLLKKELL